VFTCTVAGYVFAKYRFPGRNLLFFLVIGTILIPIQTYIVPLYVFVRQLQWLNTYQGMIFPTIIMSSGIFFLRQSIRDIPDDLIEAMRVDGANEFTILFRLIFPLSVASIAAIAIVNWVYTWSLFIWPLIVVNQEARFTMEIGLMYFQRQFITEYGGTMAATTLSLLPVLVVFLIFRTQIIEGISYSGVKG
jgi:ABC-type glycerol-3-phosphate transport system permease component